MRVNDISSYDALVENLRSLDVEPPGPSSKAVYEIFVKDFEDAMKKLELEASRTLVSRASRHLVSKKPVAKELTETIEVVSKVKTAKKSTATKPRTKRRKRSTRGKSSKK